MEHRNPASTIPKQVGHYLIQSRLGGGGFGKVYRGYDSKTGGLVAIKLIHLQQKKLEEQLELVFVEIKLLEMLDHPNIVRYVGHCVEQDYMCIILEFMEQGSLFNIIDAFDVGLPEDIASRYTRQILDGLLYLHNQGVVHRDIKAANVLVTKDGAAKLADFGASVMKNVMSEENKENKVAGTCFWMAPEVIRMASAPSPASDIWSLGATVIEMVTGNPPYANLEHAEAACFRIVQDEKPPIPSDITPECRDFLLMCMNKNPAKRASAQELLEHPWITKYTRRSEAVKKEDIDKALEREKQAILDASRRENKHTRKPKPVVDKEEDTPVSTPPQREVTFSEEIKDVITICGYLKKQSRKGWWQKRYFEFKPPVLFYYHEEGGEAAAKIEVNTCSLRWAHGQNPPVGTEFVRIELSTPDRKTEVCKGHTVFVVQASTQPIADQWFSALRKCAQYVIDKPTPRRRANTIAASESAAARSETAAVSRPSELTPVRPRSGSSGSGARSVHTHTRGDKIDSDNSKCKPATDKGDNTQIHAEEPTTGTSGEDKTKRAEVTTVPGHVVPVSDGAKSASSSTASSPANTLQRDANRGWALLRKLANKEATRIMTLITLIEGGEASQADVERVQICAEISAAISANMDLRPVLVARGAIGKLLRGVERKSNIRSSVLPSLLAIINLMIVGCMEAVQSLVTCGAIARFSVLVKDTDGGDIDANVRRELAVCLFAVACESQDMFLTAYPWPLMTKLITSFGKHVTSDVLLAESASNTSTSEVNTPLSPTTRTWTDAFEHKTVTKAQALSCVSELEMLTALLMTTCELFSPDVPCFLAKSPPHSTESNSFQSLFDGTKTMFDTLSKDMLVHMSHTCPDATTARSSSLDLILEYAAHSWAKKRSSSDNANLIADIVSDTDFVQSLAQLLPKLVQTTSVTRPWISSTTLVLVAIFTKLAKPENRMRVVLGSVQVLRELSTVLPYVPPHCALRLCQILHTAAGRNEVLQNFSESGALTRLIKLALSISIKESPDLASDLVELAVVIKPKKTPKVTAMSKTAWMYCSFKQLSEKKNSDADSRFNSKSSDLDSLGLEDSTDSFGHKSGDMGELTEEEEVHSLAASPSDVSKFVTVFGLPSLGDDQPYDDEVLVSVMKTIALVCTWLRDGLERSLEHGLLPLCVLLLQKNSHPLCEIRTVSPIVAGLHGPAAESDVGRLVPSLLPLVFKCVNYSNARNLMERSGIFEKVVVPFLQHTDLHVCALECAATWGTHSPSYIGHHLSSGPARDAILRILCDLPYQPESYMFSSVLDSATSLLSHCLSLFKCLTSTTLMPSLCAHLFLYPDVNSTESSLPNPNVSCVSHAVDLLKKRPEVRVGLVKLINLALTTSDALKTLSEAQLSAVVSALTLISTSDVSVMVRNVSSTSLKLMR